MNVNLLWATFSHLRLKISHLRSSLQILPKLITARTAVIERSDSRCVYCSVAPLASCLAISCALPTSWTYAHWSWTADWFRDGFCLQVFTAPVHNQRNSIDVSTGEANTNIIFFFALGFRLRFLFLFNNFKDHRVSISNSLPMLWTVLYILQNETITQMY